MIGFAFGVIIGVIIGGIGIFLLLSWMTGEEDKRK